MVAALALGGEAIVMGTRFMATQEAGIHQNVKEKMTEADELSTNLMFRTMHNTARVFKNSVSDQVVEIESTGNATFEDVKDLVAGQRGTPLSCYQIFNILKSCIACRFDFNYLV